jgi:hypothetical protein
MSLLEGGYSRFLAALQQQQGQPDFRASDVPTGDREHSWVPSTPTGGNLAGANAAQALAQPNAFMTHRGSLRLIGGLPRESRGYSPHTGSSALRPTLPMADPSITRAVLSVTNADDGTGNLMGEQGYALHVEQGVSRFDGPIWAGRWVRVDGVGNFTDTRAGELAAGVDPEHYYADGTVCGDSKGRDLTDIPTRVFYMQESDLPAVGDYIFQLMQDQHGLPWGGGPGHGLKLGAGKITTGWTWVTGQTNVMGRIAFNPTTAMLNGSVDTTRTYSALAPSGPGTDPNGQKDTVFGYTWNAGSRVVITANVYDEKIGSVKPWLGGVGSIPGGWSLITSSTEGAGRYLIGYAAGGDYGTPGGLLGRHPIRPLPHAPQDTTVNTTGIEVNDHDAEHVTTTKTNLSVQDHASTSVSLETTNLIISDHASSDVSSSAVIIEDHLDHAHRGPDDGYFISGIGGVSGPAGSPATDSAGDTSEVTWFYKVGFSPATGYSEGVFNVGATSTSVILSHSVQLHHHTTPAFIHEILETSHSHTTPILTHAVVESAHLHTTPILTHSLTDDGHAHATPALVHAEEDFRSPGVVMVMIKRVGPDND